MRRTQKKRNMKKEEENVYMVEGKGVEKQERIKNEVGIGWLGEECSMGRYIVI